MKKYFAFLLFCCFASYAQNTDLDGRENIEKFIKAYFISENPKFDIKNLPDYIYVNQTDYDTLTLEQKDILFKYILILLELEHKELQKSGFEYELVNHSEVNVDMLKDYRLVYDNLSSVYYIIVNQKILTHFILDIKGRIISFAPNVFGSHGGRIEPFMLDEFKD
ncbi:hypothetical protein GWA97_00235 [Flavobacterium sp. LaA7.5]|nr:hypothetical protein [Flavobacterium salilacus subsp. altitudinum]